MILAVNPIKIDGLSATRRVARERQLALPGKSVDQAGFTDITPPQKRYLGEGICRELLGFTGTR